VFIHMAISFTSMSSDPFLFAQFSIFAKTDL
jgi:hypothetical protein